MTFTTKDEVESATATVDNENEVAESSEFLNYDNVRRINHPVWDHTYDNTTSPDGSTYAIRLNGSENERIGLAKSLAVMPGDTLNIEVFAKYYEPPSGNDNLGAFATLMAAILGGSPPSGTFIDGSGYATNASTTVPGSGLPDKDNETGEPPKAYLTWLIFDKDYNLILSKSNYKRVTLAAKEDTTNVPHERLAPNEPIVIGEVGYAYIYLSNENETEVEVYFDDFKVEQVKSPVIQSQGYYPFGLTFGSYQCENTIRNRYLYNQGAGDKKFNTERVVELDLNVDQSKYRTLDYVTGRWWQVDPKGDTGGQESWSTYQFAFNNPIRYNDPEGDCLFCPLINKYSALVASFSSPSSQGALGRLATNRSGNNERKAGIQNSATPEANKAIATIGDTKTLAETTAKNTKTATNEVSKDILQTAQTAGTVMEFTPLAPIGAAINKTAGALDEARQVGLENKPLGDAITDVGVGVVIDKGVSSWGNAARSVAGGDNVVISTYESTASNFFQWIADKVTSYIRDDNKNKK